MAFVPNVNSDPVPVTTCRNDAERSFASKIRTRVPQPVRRRTTAQQGRGLELLGHAIEYLVDSDLNDQSGLTSASQSEAVQLLMHLNRELFSECEEVVSLRRRLLSRLEELLERRSHPMHPSSAAAPRS